MNTCMNQLCAFSVQVCVVLHDRLSKMLNGVQLYRRPARGGYGLRYPDPCTVAWSLELDTAAVEYCTWLVPRQTLFSTGEAFAQLPTVSGLGRAHIGSSLPGWGGFLVRGGSNRRVEACSASNALRSASNALRSYTFVLQLSRNLGSFSARQGLWPTVRVQSSPDSREENNVWDRETRHQRPTLTTHYSTPT